MYHLHQKPRSPINGSSVGSCSNPTGVLFFVAFIVFFCIFLQDSAFAQGVSGASQVSSGGGGSSGTLGEAIRNLFNPAKALEHLILGVCFLLGVYLIGSGLLSAARAASERQRGFTDAGLRLAFGAVIAAVPSALGVGLETLWGEARLGFYGFNTPGVGAPRNCIQAGSEAGLSCVAGNIATNVAPITTFVAVIFAFLAGVAMIGKGIYDIAVARTDGRHGNTQGVATRLVVGILLANVPLLANSMLATLGAPTFFGLGTTGHVIQSTLTYVPDGGGPLAQNFNSLMNSLFIILVMFGTLAIIRGLVIVKQVSENKAQGRTMGSAVTHLIAGVLMMNMNWTICVVSRTFLGTVMPFCM
jgi:hypothetical protein